MNVIKIESEIIIWIIVQCKKKRKSKRMMLDAHQHDQKEKKEERKYKKEREKWCCTLAWSNILRSVYMFMAFCSVPDFLYSLAASPNLAW